MSSTKVSKDQITNFAIVAVFFMAMIVLGSWWLYAYTADEPTSIVEPPSSTQYHENVRPPLTGHLPNQTKFSDTFQ